MASSGSTMSNSRARVAEYAASENREGRTAAPMRTQAERADSRSVCGAGARRIAGASSSALRSQSRNVISSDPTDRSLLTDHDEPIKIDRSRLTGSQRGSWSRRGRGAVHRRSDFRGEILAALKICDERLNRENWSPGNSPPACHQRECDPGQSLADCALSGGDVVNLRRSPERDH